MYPAYVNTSHLILIDLATRICFIPQDMLLPIFFQQPYTSSLVILVIHVYARLTQ